MRLSEPFAKDLPLTQAHEIFAHKTEIGFRSGFATSQRSKTGTNQGDIFAELEPETSQCGHIGKLQYEVQCP